MKRFIQVSSIVFVLAMSVMVGATIELKQSTAAWIMLGPFLDADDGITPKTGLTFSYPSVKISKAGADFNSVHNTTAPVEDVNGWYRIYLDTTDTGTLGSLTIEVNVADTTFTWQECDVVSASYWDFKHGTNAMVVADANSRSPADIKNVSSSANVGTAGTDIPSVTQLNAARDDVKHALSDVNTAVAAVSSSALATGTAQASTSSTLVLAAATAATVNYTGCLVTITAGTGAGQMGMIKSYSGATDTATMYEKWSVTPGVGATYYIWPSPYASLKILEAKR